MSDIHATRNDAEVGAISAAPRLEGGQSRMIVTTDGETPLARWGRIVPSTLVSIAVHAVLACLFVIVWRSMVRDLTAPPEPPSVEFLESMPGEATKPAGPTAPSPAPAAAPSPAPAQPKAAAPTDAAKAEPAKVEPTKAEPLPAPVAPAPPPSPDPLPAPVSPQAAQPLSDTKAAQPLSDTKAAQPLEDTKAAQPLEDTKAAEPPLDLKATKPPVTPETQPQEKEPPQTTGPESGLREPPPEPKAAATQSEATPKANAAEDPTKSPVPDKTVEADVPHVLTVPEADTSVPAFHKEIDPPKASDPDQSKSREASAHLAAALPMSTMPMPLSFRAMLSSAGTSESQEYKGVVFGVLARVEQRVDAEARQKKLMGQVVLSITLAGSGAVEKVEVVQSSGRPDVDAFALQMIRGTAFPAPPPGTSRTFTPAITFGDG